MAAFQSRRTVEWGDCDPAGIVFYPNYFRWMDAAYHAMCRHRGFDLAAAEADIEGLATPLVEAECSFAAPARPGDQLEIRVAVDRIGTSSLALAYRFGRDEAVIAQGRESRVFVQIGPAGLAKVPIPASIREELEKSHV